MEKRKQLEKDYYDRSAGDPGTLGPTGALDLHGPAAIEPHLRAPYDAYARAVSEAAPARGVVVDIGAGTGVHSLIAARDGVLVVASDLSSAALNVAAARARRLDRRIHPVVADGERLPLPAASADLVTSAGVLYCVDLARTLDEVIRVLRPEGAWVLVDSYDHNPIYRLNRMVGVLTGRRTRRAYTNIPNARTIRIIGSRFRELHIAYFGVWTFLWPVLRRLLGAPRATVLLAALEPPSRSLRRFAFKIVVVARGVRPPEQR